MDVAMIVNIVSRVPSQLWDREVPSGSLLQFVHTREPVGADIHVVYGLRGRMDIPNAPENTVFVASEPPEIREYNLATLETYRAVLAPGFEYLRGLSNFSEISAIAPWWVGASAGGAIHYEEIDQAISLHRSRLEAGFSPPENSVSVIISSKSKTDLQKQRLRLVGFLEKRLPHLQVFGEGRNPVRDKAEILMDSRYHLAVENSSHPNYWTEKLADPVLMDNVVFYGGHHRYSDNFNSESVIGINPYDLEGTYRIIRESLDRGDWEKTEKARRFNRDRVLNSLSFHRELAAFIELNTFTRPGIGLFRVPDQHPKNILKVFLDPMYRLLLRVQRPSN